VVFYLAFNEDYERLRAILGIAENASATEIKDAYRKAVKLWHPDANAPQDREKCEEVLKELNAAYHFFIKQTPPAPENEPDTIQHERKYVSPFPAATIRTLIIRGRLSAAEALLDSTALRNAEWYYLKGLVRYWAGRADAAEYLRTALAIDPSNAEYRRQLRAALRRPKGLKNSLERFFNNAFDV